MTENFSESHVAFQPTELFDSDSPKHALNDEVPCHDKPATPVHADSLGVTSNISSTRLSDTMVFNESTIPFKTEPSWHNLIGQPSVLQPLKPSRSHKVFFTCSNLKYSPLQPFPDVFNDTWDDDHVRLPCSESNLYPSVVDGEMPPVPRWKIIEAALRRKITSFAQLKATILSYNPEYGSSWTFAVLQSLLEDEFSDNEKDRFYSLTLPAMCALALNLPIYLTQPIPLLRHGQECSLTFSQLQIATLLANAFFCTFPQRTGRFRIPEYATFPRINFFALFNGESKKGRFRRLSCMREKLRCLLNYFQRVTDAVPQGTVTYTRRCLGDRAPNWSRSTKSFDALRVYVGTGSIDEADSNALQVDFANRFLGGGVLRTGCVQEEIMFVLKPELIAACLFMECLNADETVIIEGAEKYSTSTGYADEFKWAGDYRQADAGMERDEWGRWRSTAVAMDATNFRSGRKQFAPDSIIRETNKAFCGFTDTVAPHRKLPTLVATGNWGCGAFGGFAHLKALIQMTAIVEAEKSLAYFTFHDQALCEAIRGMHAFLSHHKITVGRLFSVLCSLDVSARPDPKQFYPCIKQRLLCSKDESAQSDISPDCIA